MDLKPAIHKILAVLSFFLILFLYTKLAGGIPFTVTNINTNKTDAFSVSGSGQVSVKPDSAILSLGVSASGKTVKEAQDSLNLNINKVSAAIKTLGVLEEDIQTTNYNISPTYDYRTGSQTITGYAANTNLSIKIKDLTKANSIIDGATAAGANQVGGISFEVSDKLKAQNEAREKAVSEARMKATQAAKIAGFSLGKIINYSESFEGEMPRPLMMKAAQGDQEVSTSLETGSTDIKVTVTLSYEVR